MTIAALASQRRHSNQEKLGKPWVNLMLAYSHHALREAEQDKVVGLPVRIPPYASLVEVQKVGGVMLQQVVRFPFDLLRDIVMVVRRDGMVKTVWTNNRTDTHTTLRVEAYSR